MSVKWVDGDNETRTLGTQEVESLFRRATLKKTTEKKTSKEHP